VPDAEGAAMTRRVRARQCISVSLHADVIEELDRVCSEQQLIRSRFIEELLTKGLNDYNQLFDTIV
jgi:metal-responsive CopG/Arc/MetJ family transcriptional regulator